MYTIITNRSAIYILTAMHQAWQYNTQYLVDIKLGIVMYAEAPKQWYFNQGWPTSVSYGATCSKQRLAQRVDVTQADGDVTTATEEW